MIREESFRARIVDRFCLNERGTGRETWHIILETEKNLPPFLPGDSIGVFPKNQKMSVEGLLKYFGEPFDSVVVDRKGRSIPSYQWLREHVKIHKVTDGLLEAVARNARTSRDRDHLAKLVEQEKEKIIAEYELLQFLQEHVGGGVSLHDIAQYMPPLRPRLYSIASGPSLSQNRLELIVARVVYEMGQKVRRGVCSHFLIEESCLNSFEISFFHQPSRHFIFPKEEASSLIMIGAGTGIAPFRSFMQEISLQKVPPPFPCWLFFGERKSEADFYYEDFWKSHVEKGNLRLNLAFSQDQEHKIYVQHRMWEERSSVWRWLQEGAHLFVCGHAQKMAKDVEKCLIDIAREEGSLTEEHARGWLQSLREARRYMKDVY